MSGTSAAGPNAAGVMALVLSYRPCLTGAQVKKIIERSADTINSLTYTYTVNLASYPNGPWRKEMGYGKINAFAALQEAANTVAYPCLSYMPLACAQRPGEGISERKGKIKQSISIQTYPNPFNNNIILDLDLLEASVVDVNIYDYLGRKVKTISDRKISDRKWNEAGKYNKELHTSDLPEGIYFLEVEAFREMIKVIKMN